MTAESKPQVNLLRQMLRGSMWSISLRWANRLMGLISTVVLARLLTPADYGIVAIAMLVVGVIEIFSQTGQRNAIIRHPNPTREHYNSAWTVSLLLGFALASIIWIFSSLGSAYFHEPRAVDVIHVLAFRSMILGFENIGTLNFQRHLKFHRQFLYSTSASLVSFVVTITSAFILRSYWALVIGIMTQQIATVALSYLMEPFRPWFSFAKVREIWSFSIWTLFRAVGFYLNMQVDKLAIGGFAGAAAMGRYDVAMDVSTSPIRELNLPMVGVLFPVMVQVQNDKEKRRHVYLTTLYWSGLICVSTSLGIALVSNDLVGLVLGAKWNDAKPLMPWLALSFGLLGLSASVYSAFDTVGRADVSARLQWIRLLCLAVCVFPVAYLGHSLEAVAITRFVVTLAIMPGLFFALSKGLDLPLRDFLVTLWRPFAAGTFMTGVVLAINSVLPFTGQGRLFIDVVAGAASYVGALMLLWLLNGRPDGPEAMVWNWRRNLSRHADGSPSLSETTTPISDRTT